MSSPINLPQVTVQLDALGVIRDVEQGIIESEDIWVSCYDLSKPSVHGKVAVMISDEDRTQCAFKGREGVECKRIKDTIFHIRCPALHINDRALHFPNRIITLPEMASTKTSSKLDRGINSLDVSADGQIWVAGLGNGSVLVGANPPTKNDAIYLEGNFHKGSVSAVRLVCSTTAPMKLRILSGSEDFSITVVEIPNLPLPTSNGSNTSVQSLPPPSIRLTSHTRSVTSAQSLPCGTKVISAGRDGTLRIWDLTPDPPAASRQIGLVRSTGDVAINSLAVSSTPHSVTLAALALQSGHFDLIDVEARGTLFSSSTSGFEYSKNGPLDAIDIFALPDSPHKYLVVTGSQRGVLSLYVCAVENSTVVTTGLGSCVRNGAGISDVKFMSLPDDSRGKYPRVLVATMDGLPYQLQISKTSDESRLEFEVVAEYAGGADCLPVRSLAWHAESETVWIAGDDGVIWVY
ncbi:WD40-repeat-containing domain protein [Rhizoctonia solani]|nr:WD40-repeat-containing domain protein [Rhizoctonia solani]